MRNDYHLRQSDISRLIGAAHGELKMAIFLAALAGLRIGEIADLQWDDIDLQRGVIRYVPNRRRAGMVPISPELAAYLEGWREGNSLNIEVFAAPGTRIRLRRKLFQLAQRLNVGRVCFHDFRHWLTREMIASGTSSVDAIAAALGHRPPYDTARLTTITIEELWLSIVREKGR